MRVVVAGAGQVGTAVAEVLGGAHDVTTVDVGDEVPAADVLVVAFRWSGRFVKDVKRLEGAVGPAVTVVHSTVPVGTCRANGWVHAPVRGRHPDLEVGVRTFRMQFGGVHSRLAELVYAGCGVVSQCYERADEVEAGKLWELAQLAIQVRVQHELYDWCERNGVGPEQVYRDAAQVYNEGYRQLDPKFVRPILDYDPGPLGGHCVAANAPLLECEFVEDMLDPLMPS